MQPCDDPLILINLSVWRSVEALKTFVYKSGHQISLRDRSKWFERPQQAHMTLWWIPAGHIPTVREALYRLELRRRHGDTAASFSLSKPYPEPKGRVPGPLFLE